MKKSWTRGEVSVLGWHLSLIHILYNGIVTAVLFVTVLFANFAESVAEGRGKAQAASLKKTKKDTKARILLADGEEKMINASELKKGDVVLVKMGEVIPNDGEVIEGIASVDESAITGESAPVTRESGGDFSSVTGGTTVVSDWLKIRIVAEDVYKRQSWKREEKFTRCWILDSGNAGCASADRRKRENF